MLLLPFRYKYNHFSICCLLILLLTLLHVLIFIDEIRRFDYEIRKSLWLIAAAELWIFTKSIFLSYQWRPFFCVCGIRIASILYEQFHHFFTIINTTLKKNPSNWVVTLSQICMCTAHTHLQEGVIVNYQITWWRAVRPSSLVLSGLTPDSRSLRTAKSRKTWLATYYPPKH